MTGSSRLEVRAAQRDDAAALGRFVTMAWQASGPGALGFTGATDAVIADLATETTLHAIIDDDQTSVWIALASRAIVGFAATRIVTDRRWELAGIIVEPTHAGSGIGTALAGHAMERASRDGATSMVVRTEPHNEPAIGFYEKLGFARSGTAEEVVGDHRFEVVELTVDLSDAPRV